MIFYFIRVVSQMAFQTQSNYKLDLQTPFYLFISPYYMY